MRKRRERGREEECYRRKEWRQEKEQRGGREEGKEERGRKRSRRKGGKEGKGAEKRVGRQNPSKGLFYINFNCMTQMSLVPKPSSHLKFYPVLL